MQEKVHYKLHKVKKTWVALAVSSLSIAALGATGETTVSADQVNTWTGNGFNISVSTDDNTTTRVIVNGQDVAPTTTTNPATTDTPSANQGQGSTDSTDTTATTNPATSTVTDKQASPSITDANSQATPTATDTTPSVPSDSQSRIENDRPATSASTDHIQTEDGKSYYVTDYGNRRKNYLLEDGDKTYYFGRDGARVDQTVSPVLDENAPVTTYAQGNRLVNTDEKSIEAVDTFLTADSWYRPKAILTNGTTWTDSSENDLRPLLMVWWPDTTTQVAYLDFMKKTGLGATTSYSVSSDSATLNKAAQEVQAKIEQRISSEGNTQWLRTAMSDFVKTQNQWNINSENKGNDHLQGGQLVFENAQGKTAGRTDYANSNYRLLNRTPTNQTGTPKYFDDRSLGGNEFLLANDIDNSNPAVQAEQLNWLHYIMNIGSIMANDSSANFDGVRVDALDNVDADLLQIASDYFKQAYGVDDSQAKAIAHLSIFEGWSYNDPLYNKDHKGAQLAIDNHLREALVNRFLWSPGSRSLDMKVLMTNSLSPRNAEAKNTERTANYLFVRAHDSEVQSVIQTIVQQNINSSVTGYRMTLDEIKQAFKIYNEDMKKTDKRYTQYNIPAAYAFMLTNKDTVTRVYYGDVFTDDGHYMAEKSPYYDALDALMKARVKYVAGGQDMTVQTVGSGDLLTSVRYGKGANSVSDQGTNDTRTQGMVLLMSNNTQLNLGGNTHTVAMGAAHKNQAYRPVLLSRADGLSVYNTDQEVPSHLIKYTDSNGNLTFTASDIFGVANPQVSGYLAVWVPVGASDNQDARTKATDTKNSSGLVYESNAALDSQLIFEGFSNFQAFAENESQYMNKIIPQKIDLLKSWGVTSFEMPPQYVSSKDGTFLDSVIDNGYAFSDRYDIALSGNNKYGSLDDLLNAIRALHAGGMSVMADWVPDQIYSLPGKEVVTASRADGYGNPRSGANIYHSAYVANTKTDGTDYQGQYGGKYLDELKAKYPAIFERVQISNGKQMPTDEKITQWSAKYFNGSNILGRGAGYVLKDQSTGNYFDTSADKLLLPQALRKTDGSGFAAQDNKVIYRFSDGKQAKSQFVTVDGNSYYFDQNGYMATGKQTINGKQYYFLANGVQVRQTFRQEKDGSLYYYALDGAMVINQFFDFDSTRTLVRAFTTTGKMVTGLLNWGGGTYYFDKENGFQAKDKIIRFADGSLRYFLPDSGNLGRNIFAQDQGTGVWYYFGNDGRAVTGAQTIKGQKLYFDKTGAQIKGQLVFDNGKSTPRYYEANSGSLLTNSWYSPGDNVWYYFGADGNALTGLQTIRGQRVLFASTGVQIKGAMVTLNGKTYQTDANSGSLLTNTFVSDQTGNWYYLGGDGAAVTGQRTINGQSLYFYSDGRQAKGTLVESGASWAKQIRYYDANSGELFRNGFKTIDGKLYYFARNGLAYVNTTRTIDGRRYRFDANGIATAV